MQKPNLRNWMKELALEGKFDQIPEAQRAEAKAWLAAQPTKAKAEPKEKKADK